MRGINAFTFLIVNCLSVLLVGNNSKNPPVRIWLPLYNTLKKVGRKWGFPMGDFVSVLVFRAIYDNPSLVKYVLMTDYGFDEEKAQEIFEELIQELFQNMNLRLVSREIFEVPVNEWKEAEAKAKPN